MASLKEVKTRILSVSTTRKITQARQMISSAQLHRTQDLLADAVQYKESLDNTLYELIDDCEAIDLPLTQEHKKGLTAIVIMASNSGMSGAFNINMVKELNNIRKHYSKDELLLFPIGKKIRDAAAQNRCNIGFEKGINADHLAGKTTYEQVSEFATQLIQLFLDNQVKQIKLVYYQYKSMAKQEIKEITWLPYSVSSMSSGEKEKNKISYIFEPNRKEILEKLIPMALKANLYHAVMENQTSEHAARTIAMQLATENADEILDELKLTYNKLRQQNITSELQDIVGGRFA